MCSYTGLHRQNTVVVIAITANMERICKSMLAKFNVEQRRKKRHSEWVFVIANSQMSLASTESSEKPRFFISSD